MKCDPQDMKGWNVKWWLTYDYIFKRSLDVVYFVRQQKKKDAKPGERAWSIVYSTQYSRKKDTSHSHPQQQQQQQQQRKKIKRWCRSSWHLLSSLTFVYRTKSCRELLTIWLWPIPTWPHPHTHSIPLHIRWRKCWRFQGKNYHHNDL